MGSAQLCSPAWGQLAGRRAWLQADRVVPLQQGWALGAERSFTGRSTELLQSMWSLQPLRLPRQPPQVFTMLGWALQRLVPWQGSWGGPSDVACGALQVRGGVQAGPGWEVLPDAV